MSSRPESCVAYEWARVDFSGQPTLIGFKSASWECLRVLTREVHQIHISHRSVNDATDGLRDMAATY